MFLKLLAEEKGSFVIEVSLIVPIIILIICTSLTLTIEKCNEAVTYIEERFEEYDEIQRYPKDIINNTDLAVEYIGKIRKLWEDGVK